MKAITTIKIFTKDLRKFNIVLAQLEIMKRKKLTQPEVMVEILEIVEDHLNGVYDE